jgi:hypothetical protein
MKRIMILCSIFLILLFFSVDVTASDTRIRGLGYKANFYIRDSHNIWEFPSTVVLYRSMAFAESMFPAPSDSGQYWSGGLHFPVSQSFVLGVYLRNSQKKLPDADTQFMFQTYADRSTGYYPNLSGNDASHLMTLFGGLQMGNTDLGFHVSLHRSSYSVQYTDALDADKRKTYEDKLNYLTLGGGVSHKTNERTRIDGSIFYSMGSFSNIDPSFHDSDTLKQRQPESYYDYRVAARMFYALNPKVILVPFGQYGQNSRGYRSIDKDTSPLNVKSSILKNTYYMLGAALELIPRTNAIVALAAGFRGESWQTITTYFDDDNTLNPTTKLTTLPFVSIGLEGRLAKWLDARLSFYELLNTHNIERDNGINNIFDRTTMTGSLYAATFGLSFHLGRFDLDTLIDINGAASFLHNGPAMISGKDYSEEGLFSQISLIYRFQ